MGELLGWMAADRMGKARIADDVGDGAILHDGATVAMASSRAIGSGGGG